MKTKKLLTLLLALALLAGLLPMTASADPSYDSRETICLYVGQKLEYQRPEPFALDYAGLTAYFKSDAYTARAYTAEVIFGAEEKPDWFCLGVQPSRPGRFLYYGYTEVGAGTEYNLNPYYTVKDTDRGTRTFYLRVTMALGSKTKTVVHKVTLLIEDQPRVARERTVYLLPDKEPVDGRAVVKPGGLVHPADLAFPLPAAAWKYTEPEGHAAGMAAYFTYDWTGELPTRLAIGSRHVSGLPYYMPDWEENSGPYLYRYDYAWPTREGEYSVLFRIRPRGEGDYFAPFNYRVRFIVSPAGAPYDLWIDGVQLNRLNALDPTGDGAFCYDPDTQTLGIRGSHESSYADGAMYPIFELSGDTEINAMTGKTMTLECTEWTMGGCIEVRDSTLTLRDLDSLTLRHRGSFAPLQGGGESACLVVESSVVTAECAGADPYSGAITGFRGGIELRGSAVKEPRPWGIDAEGSVTDGAGALAKTVSFIRAPKLTIRSVTGSALSWKIDNLPDGGEKLVLVAAAYDGNGKQLGITMTEKTAAGADLSGQLRVVPGGASYKLFLTDAEYRPLIGSSSYPAD